MGARPQSLINEQFVLDADILIGVFWTRLGTPTGREESGTVEEVREFLARGKPVLIYFSNRPIAPDRIDPEQYRKVSEFKRRCRQEGIVFDFDSIDQLRELVYRHLLGTVQRLRVAADS
jgi:hypothetical protein